MNYAYICRSIIAYVLVQDYVQCIRAIEYVQTVPQAAQTSLRVELSEAHRERGQMEASLRGYRTQEQDYKRCVLPSLEGVVNFIFLFILSALFRSWRRRRATCSMSTIACTARPPTTVLGQLVRLAQTFPSPLPLSCVPSLPFHLPSLYLCPLPLRSRAIPAHTHTHTYTHTHTQTVPLFRIHQMKTSCGATHHLRHTLPKLTRHPSPLPHRDPHSPAPHTLTLTPPQRTLSLCH